MTTYRSDLWGNPGTVALISGLSMILCACLPLIPSIVAAIRRKTSSKATTDTPSLTQHPFFDRSESIKHHIDMTFTLENKGKELIFKEVLIVQITIYQKDLHRFCQRVDANEFKESNELYEAYLKMVDDMTYDHYHFYETSMHYSASEVAIFQKVMKKYVIWNTPHMNLLQQNVIMVCNSSYITDINTQTAVVMDLFGGIMINSLTDAIKSLDSINGDLKGCVYKGVTV